MAAEWREARLIPTSGIRGAVDQEVRATSALLSVLTVVPQFAHSMLKPCGAPLGPKRANVKAYTEVAFEDKKNKRTPRPDGLIRVERGSSSWTALVEVKTQTNGLDKDQVESYMDVARENEFDAVITISNEIPPILGTHPLDLDKRKLRSMPVYHFSWVRLISLAVASKEVHGIEDEEQAWILSELIRYLEHENSGALEFEDMGGSWTAVTDAVRTGIVRRGDPDVADVAAKFDGLVRYMALKLGQKLRVDVEPMLSQRERTNPDLRTESLARELAEDHTMSAKIRIPGTAADLAFRCDMRARRIHVHAKVPASGHTRNETRVNWLLRPLAEISGDVIVEAHAARRQHAATIEEYREDPKGTLPEAFPEIKSFTVSRVYDLGMSRRTTAKMSFINSVIAAVDDFYINLLQPQKVWTRPAPRYKPISHAGQEEETYSSEEISGAASNEGDEVEVEV
ncbi:hypothetical protein ACO0LV_12020 [Pseudactinotalea sp. Z1739]|uniref:hypothetical protein n=1 Tax=Pseudactinotalea sp. Z1739 TaxID=3413028 RepID=UPI003C7CB0B2